MQERGSKSYLAAWVVVLPCVCPLGWLGLPVWCWLVGGSGAWCCCLVLLSGLVVSSGHLSSFFSEKGRRPKDRSAKAAPLELPVSGFIAIVIAADQVVSVGLFFCLGRYAMAVVP